MFVLRAGHPMATEAQCNDYSCWPLGKTAACIMPYAFAMEESLSILTTSRDRDLSRRSESDTGCFDLGSTAQIFLPRNSRNAAIYLRGIVIRLALLSA